MVDAPGLAAGFWVAAALVPVVCTPQDSRQLTGFAGVAALAT